jgi:hypothetical protein
MNNSDHKIRLQLIRQVNHWVNAASRLRNLDELASSEAWANLENYLGLSIQRYLMYVIEELNREAVLLKSAIEAANSDKAFLIVRRQLYNFRNRYSRVETTLAYFADAVNTRTSKRITGYLKACDSLAYRSMTQLLDLLDKKTPIVLTYIDKGLGASILKAGMRLWDGTSINPVAAIKITRHNLLRPTALIHESGHQVAHLINWNSELASALESGLRDSPAGVAETWASWSSEIAADAFAFVHTGYASVAALHDVVDGGPRSVFRYTPGDPHPVSYIRVLLNVEMCRQFYGNGPWDDLEWVWKQHYPIDSASSGTVSLLRNSLEILPKIVEITLQKSMKSFGGRSLSDLINPERVKPETLLEMESQLGAALFTSMHWIWTESLRLLALTGLNTATNLEKKDDLIRQQEDWMLRLGGTLQAA